MASGRPCVASWACAVLCIVAALGCGPEACAKVDGSPYARFDFYTERDGLSSHRVFAVPVEPV